VARVLFYRDFQNFTGGHLKVWDYYNHADTAPGYQADIYFSPSTCWDATNPWLGKRAQALPHWAPHGADVVFLGGHDWLQIPAPERSRFGRPVINLIQHVQHGDTAHPLAAYLPHRAIRLCVSAEVQSAIEATGRVHGPTIVIPNGVDLPMGDDQPWAERTLDWLICGVKEGQSALAREIGRQIQGTFGSDRVEVMTKLLPRADFLAKLAQAKRAVLLPRATEGFYLPALEAMALGALVICPDCIGNRSFCQEGRTAIVPESREPAALWAAVQRARSLPAGQAAARLANARAVAAQHSLTRERAAFQHVLASISSLW
jgi:hypothetical protein